jgi:hypothetical protein
MDGGLVVTAAWRDTDCRPHLEHPITSPRKTERNGDAKLQSTGARNDAREFNDPVLRLVVMFFPAPGSSGLRVRPLLLPLSNKRTNWQGERNNFLGKSALLLGKQQVNLGNADEARLALGIMGWAPALPAGFELVIPVRGIAVTGGHLQRRGLRRPGFIAVPIAVGRSPGVKRGHDGKDQADKAKPGEPKGAWICFHGGTLSRNRSKLLIEKIGAGY